MFGRREAVFFCHKGTGKVRLNHSDPGGSPRSNAFPSASLRAALCYALVVHRSLSADCALTILTPQSVAFPPQSEFEQSHSIFDPFSQNYTSTSTLRPEGLNRHVGCVRRHSRLWLLVHRVIWLRGCEMLAFHTATARLCWVQGE
eukprot:EG_transcript_34077